MNPVRWVRWKVVVSILVVGGLLYFLGIDPFARWQINAAGRNNPAARWSVDNVAMALLAGDLQFEKIEVATARKQKPSPSKEGAVEENGAEKEEKVLNAAVARVDVSVNELLRRRVVVEEVSVEMPRMTILRRRDGSTNVGDLGGETEEEDEAEEGKDALDWVESAIDWYKKIQKWREKLGGGEGEEGEEAEEKEKTDVDYYAKRIQYPFNKRPGVVIQKVAAKDLEVQFLEEEEDPSALLPRLRKGEITLSELSDRPHLHGSPVQLSIGGELGVEKLGWAGLSLDLMLDVTGKGEPFISLDVGAKHVPAGVVEAFVGKSLPVRLSEGSLGLTTNFKLSLADGAGRFLEPLKPGLSFQGMRLEAKDPSGNIAGVPAQEFVKTFNDAASMLDGESKPLTITDLEITGSIESPDFSWGDTVKNLALQVSEALARREAAKLGKKLEKELDRGLKKAEEALGGTPLDGIKKPLEEILPEKESAEDAAKKGVDFLRGGIFGEDSKGKDAEKRE